MDEDRVIELAAVCILFGATDMEDGDVWGAWAAASEAKKAELRRMARKLLTAKGEVVTEADRAAYDRAREG